MSFFRRNRSFTLAFLLIVLLGSVLQFDTSLSRAMKGSMRGMSALVWEAAHSTRETFEGFGGVASRTALAAENKSLKDEIARLQSLSLHNDVLRSENATLRSMFSLKEAEPHGIAAPVLSNPAVSPYGTFVIGSGKADQVAVGDFVLSAPRVAIGRVIEADEHTALVELFSAPGKVTEVSINGVRTDYTGRGDGNGMVALPRGVNVAVGDAAQLPGTLFAIGFVGSTKSDPQDAEVSILLRIPANLPSLSFIYVVSPAH